MHICVCIYACAFVCMRVHVYVLPLGCQLLLTRYESYMIG